MKPLTSASEIMAQAKHAPKQTSETYGMMLYNEEIELFTGLAKALAKQGVPIFRPDGKPIKHMLVREALRIAAEVTGGAVGDKKLVELAQNLKASFRTVRVPNQAWRSRFSQPAASRSNSKRS